MNNLPNRDRELRRAFDEGRTAPLVVEARRTGRRGWTPVLDLHAQEREDIGRMRALAPHGAGNIDVAIHPESGRLGLFVIAATESELDLRNGGVSPADPAVRAEETAQMLETQVAAAVDHATALLSELAGGRELSYEDVYQTLPPSVRPEVLRGVLRQSCDEPLDVLVNGRERTLGGYVNIPKEVSSRCTYRFHADVRQINRDGRPNGTVTLKLLSGIAPSNPFPLDLSIGKTIEAHLRTRNDQRSLALLHLPGLYEVTAKVDIGVCSNLFTGRTTFFVEDVDVSEAAQRARPIQQILDA